MTAQGLLTISEEKKREPFGKIRLIAQREYQLWKSYSGLGLSLEQQHEAAHSDARKIRREYTSVRVIKNINGCGSFAVYAFKPLNDETLRYRQRLELALGKKISTPEWYQIQDYLAQNGLEVNDAGIGIYGTVRKMTAHNQNMAAAIAAYQQAVKYTDPIISSISGTEVKRKLVKDFNLDFQRATVDRWLNESSEKKKQNLNSHMYGGSELLYVFFRAFFYASRKNIEVILPTNK